jgi:hypothetical protein
MCVMWGWLSKEGASAGSVSVLAVARRRPAVALRVSVTSCALEVDCLQAPHNHVCSSSAPAARNTVLQNSS